METYTASQPNRLGLALEVMDTAQVAIVIVPVVNGLARFTRADPRVVGVLLHVTGVGRFLVVLSADVTLYVAPLVVDDSIATVGRAAAAPPADTGTGMHQASDLAAAQDELTGEAAALEVNRGGRLLLAVPFFLLLRLLVTSGSHPNGSRLRIPNSAELVVIFLGGFVL